MRKHKLKFNARLPDSLWPLNCLLQINKKLPSLSVWWGRGRGRGQGCGSEALSKLHNCPKHAPFAPGPKNKKIKTTFYSHSFICIFASIFCFRDYGDNSLVSQTLEPRLGACLWLQLVNKCWQFNWLQGPRGKGSGKGIRTHPAAANGNQLSTTDPKCST